MKFRVTFKTSDAVDDAIQDTTRMEIRENPDAANAEIEQEQITDLREMMAEEIRLTTDKFVSHGEYITVEFDTDTDTAIVVPKNGP